MNGKRPLNVHASNVDHTSFNLSWEFTMEDKLSPFQGFFVQYRTSNDVYSCETTVNHVELVGLKPYTNYTINVAPRYLIGFGLISEMFSVQTAEWSKSMMVNFTLIYNVIIVDFTENSYLTVFFQGTGCHTNKFSE